MRWSKSIALPVVIFVFVAGSMPARAGLVAWYEFDEPAGSTQAEDSSGNELHGTLGGFDATVDSDFVPGSGMFGGAIHFDGLDDVVETTELPHPAESFTYAYWFRPDADMNPNDGRVDLAYSNARPHFSFDRDADHRGKIAIYYNIDGEDATTQVRSTTTSWAADSWHHLAFTWDGTDVKMFVDGVQEGSNARSGTQGVSPGIKLGSNNGGNPFDGMMDDFAVWDDWLAPSEIASVFSGGVESWIPTTLTWDQLGPGSWGDDSRWESGPAVPDAASIAVVASDIVTVDAGGAARELSVIDGGGIAIAGGQTLSIQRDVDFEAGTTLALGASATLVVEYGGGSIDSMAAAGDATVSNATGLKINTFSDGGVPGTFTKQGSGTLSLDNVSAAQTHITVAGGTLNAAGADGLGGAGHVTLDGGTLRLRGGEALSPNVLSGLFFDVPTGQPDTLEPIDAGNGVLTQVPGWTLGLAGPLDFADNTMQDYIGVPEDDYAAAWRGVITVGSPNLPAGDVSFGLSSDDGNVLYIDLNDDGDFQDAGELVVADNVNHGFQSVEGTVNLAAGSYNFVTAFYERGGGDGITVRFAAGTGLAYDAMTTIDPTDPGQDGIWSGLAVEPIDGSSLEVTVTNDSALEAVTDFSAAFGRLSMVNGILTTRGALRGVTFAGVDIPSDTTGTVGFDPLVTTQLGAIDGNLAAVTVAKAGSGTLTLDTPNQELDNATFEARGGTLAMVGSAAWGGAHSASLNGGTLQIEGDGTDYAAVVDVTVSADSTLSAIADGQANFGPLTMEAGVLTTAGATLGMGFADTTIAAAATAVGFDPQVPTDLGEINVDSSAVAISKTGSGDLVLTPANVGTGFENATLVAAEGRLIGVHDGNPFGAAALSLQGGELVLSSAGSDVTYDSPVTVEFNSVLSAGAAGAGVAGPVTVTLGSETNGVTLNNGTLTLRATDDYRLHVAGDLAGPGSVLLTEGDVTLAGSGDVNLLKVTGGAVDLAVDLNVVQMQVLGGAVDTGPNRVIVSESLKLGGTTIGVADATFTAGSADLGDAAVADNLTVGGGTVSLLPGTLSQATILLVSDDPYQSGTARDDSLVELLESLGHKVDTSGMGAAYQDGNTPFDGDVKEAALNDADLVVVTRRTNSGSYDDSPALWNELETPLLLMSGYITRDSRWGWAGASGDANVAEEEMLVVTGQEDHPFLDGLSDPVQVFDWSDVGGQAPKGVYLPNVGTAQDPDHVVGTLDGRPFLMDIPQSYDLGSFGITGERRAFMGHWGYDIETYVATDLITEDFESMLQNVLTGLLPASGPGPIEMENTNITATADTTLFLYTEEDATFGDLRLEGGVALTLDGAAASFNGLAAGDGTSITADAVVLRGTLALDAGPVTLSVDGEVELEDTATYVCDPANDQLQVTGDVYLAGTLELHATSPMGDLAAGEWGEKSQTVLSVTGDEGAIIGTFDDVPVAGEHVGSGVFLQEIVYSPEFDATAVEVSAFQAAPGDVNGDQKVDNTDLQQILGAGSFGSPGDWQWPQGDFNGDGDVNNNDLQTILGTGLFGAGVYAAGAGDMAPVPEPGALLLLLTAALGLLLWGRRRG